MPLVSCPFCRFTKEVPFEGIPSGIFSARCPQCAQIFETGPFYFASEESNVKNKKMGSPWEHRDKLGFLDGLIKTVATVLFKPALFYKNICPSEGISDSFSFGIITGVAGSIITILWGFIIAMLSLNMEIPILEVQSDITPTPLILLYPLFVICNILITALIIHVLLFLVRANSGKIGGTLQVISYSQAAKLFSIIPVLGDIISFFWQMVIIFIGLKTVHNTSYIRLIIAFVIPFIIIAAVFLVCIFFIITQFGSEILQNELNLDFFIKSLFAIPS